MNRAILLSNGEHLIWQINRGLLSPLYLPNPKKLLSLPPGDRQWQVYELDLDPNETQNLTVKFGRRAWILALMGTFDQDEGFKATLWDSKRKIQFQTSRELFSNLIGTAQNPAWMPTPAELQPNTSLFLRVTNLSSSAGTGEIVLYSHLEAEEGLSHGR